MFLVHSVVIRTLRARLIEWASVILHAQSPDEAHPASLSWMLANGVAVIITIVVAIVSAVLFQQKVEGPMLRWAKQIESRMASPEEKYD